MILSLIFYVSIIFVSLFFIFSLFSRSYKFPLLGFIILSPFVFASWSNSYFGISLIHIFSFIFIFVFFIKLLSKQEIVYEFPYINLFILYFVAIIIVSINIYINTGIIPSIDFFSKSVFMPLSFYLFYRYFKDIKSIKILAIFFILAGLFPLLFVLLQKITGHIWFYRGTRGLIRNVGLYHDAVTPRIFLIQSLIGIMIFWHYFLRKEAKFTKIMLSILFCMFVVGLYFLYSKTIIVTFLVWILLYTFYERKVYLVPLIILLVIASNFISGKVILNQTNQLFSREIQFIEGNLKTESALSGRGKIWIGYAERWPTLSLAEKLIGVGTSHGYFHNDFLRMLFCGGIFLLFFYILLFLVLVVAIVFRLLKVGQFIYFSALLCISYYFIESLGQLPGLYPNIQIFTWGIAGLSLNKKYRIKNSLYNFEEK